MKTAALFLAGLVPRLLLIILMASFSGLEAKASRVDFDTIHFVELSGMIFSGVRPEHSSLERLALGWPILLAPFRAVGHPVWVAIALATLLAALLPLVYFKTTNSFSGAMLVGVLTPDWILLPTLGLSEPALLFCAMLSVYYWTKKDWLLSGLCVGLAILIRPTAVVVGLAIGVGWCVDRDWKNLLRWGAITAVVGAFTLALNDFYYGDAFRQFHRYTDALGYQRSLFGWPVVSALHGFLEKPQPVWKVAYILSHVAVALFTCVVGLPRKGSEPLHYAMWVWAALNTILILSIDRWWGFESISRYWLWAMPAYFYLAYRWLRKFPTLFRVAHHVAVPLSLVWVCAIFFMERR